jgi:hypothetical protein
MDAIVQVEAAEVRAVVTNTNVIIFEGRHDDSLVFTWTIVADGVYTLLEHSIVSNAPNSSILLV